MDESVKVEQNKGRWDPILLSPPPERLPLPRCCCCITYNTMFSSSAFSYVISLKYRRDVVVMKQSWWWKLYPHFLPNFYYCDNATIKQPWWWSVHVCLKFPGENLCSFVYTYYG